MGGGSAHFETGCVCENPYLLQGVKKPSILVQRGLKKVQGFLQKLGVKSGKKRYSGG